MSTLVSSLRSRLKHGLLIHLQRRWLRQTLVQRHSQATTTASDRGPEVMQNWNHLVRSHGNWQDLRTAAIEGDEENLRLHLQGGVDPNFQPFETNPLFDAIRAGQINSVKILIRNGADPRVKEISTGMTAGEVALYEGQNEIAEYINMMLRYM